MDRNKKRGIVLMNLGSPDSTSPADVKRYLMEFLMDGRVIDYPYLLRKLLVGGIIVPFRTSRSAAAYESVWTSEGSPLITITRQLQAHVQQKVSEPVEIAMRYGNPSVEDAYRSLMKKLPGLEEVIAIPMYPHYAMSSYETAVEFAKEIYRKKKFPFRLQFIKPYFDNGDYQSALTESIRPYLQDYDHILFSYHGIPRRHIFKSDVTGAHCLKNENCCEVPSPSHDHCYRHQCLETMRMVAASLNIPPAKFSYSFQSRLGREEWLRPYTDHRLAQLPQEGIKKLLIVCPAFVSDCLETLQEIAMEGKHIFNAGRRESFTLIPCLNVHPLWVRSIINWVREYAGGKNEMILQ